MVARMAVTIRRKSLPKPPTSSDLRAEVGALIRSQREVSGLTQQELADQAERSLELIGKIERGAAAPSFDTLAALATTLNVPVAAFFRVGMHSVGDGNKPLARIVDRLSRLDADDLEWADEMLKVAMRRKVRAS